MGEERLQLIPQQYKGRLKKKKKKAKTFERLGERDRFLDKCDLPKLNQEEAKSLNSPITTDDTDTVIQKLSTHKSAGLDRRILRSI